MLLGWMGLKSSIVAAQILVRLGEASNQASREREREDAKQRGVSMMA